MAYPLTSSNNSGSGTGTNGSITLPAGIAAGDLILIFATLTANDTITTPSGYTVSVAKVGTAPCSYLFSKIATGSEGGTSVTLTISSATNWNAQCRVYQSATLDISTGSHNGSTASTTIAMGAATPSYASDIAVVFAGALGSAANTMSTPTGFGNVLNDATSASGTTANLVVYSWDASGLVTGGTAYTPPSSTATVSDKYTSMTVMVTPNSATHLVQSAISIGSTGAPKTLAKAYPSNVTSGDLLVAFVGSFDATAWAVTDTQGNTWNLAKSVTSSISNPYTNLVYWAVAGSTGANTVTATFTSSGSTVDYPVLGVAQYHGSGSGTWSVDAAALVGATATGTAVASGSFTTGQAAEILVSWYSDDAGGTLSAITAGWIKRQSSNPSGLWAIYDRVTTSTGTFSFSATENTSADWLEVVAGFYQASGTTDTGSGSVAVGSLTMSATSLHTAIGVMSDSLGAMTVVATSQRTTFGNVAGALGNVAVSATSKRTAIGSAAVAVGNVSLSALGFIAGLVTGVASAALGAVSVAVTGKRTAFGNAAAALGALVVSATSKRTAIGHAAAAFGNVAVSVVGKRTAVAHAAVTLGNVTVSAFGTVAGLVTGVASVALGGVTVAGQGVRTAVGRLAVALGNLTVAAGTLAPVPRVVKAAARSFGVAAGARSFGVAASARSFGVAASARLFKVAAGVRSFVVKADPE